MGSDNCRESYCRGSSSLWQRHYRACKCRRHYQAGNCQRHLYVIIMALFLCIVPDCVYYIWPNCHRLPGFDMLNLGKWPCKFSVWHYSSLYMNNTEILLKQKIIGINYKVRGKPEIFTTVSSPTAASSPTPRWGWDWEAPGGAQGWWQSQEAGWGQRGVKFFEGHCHL